VTRRGDFQKPHFGRRTRGALGKRFLNVGKEVDPSRRWEYYPAGKKRICPSLSGVLVNLTAGEKKKKKGPGEGVEEKRKESTEKRVPEEQPNPSSGPLG